MHEKTKLECPRNSTNASPVSALHSRNDLSSLAVTMYEDVGDHVTSVLSEIGGVRHDCMMCEFHIQMMIEEEQRKINANNRTHH